MPNNMTNIPTRKKPKKEQEDNLFIQLFNKYIFYWPLFLALFILFFSAAYVYLRYATPLYEATATLVIKDEKKGADDSKSMDALKLISTNKIIENEVEVLKSRKIMSNVVRSLHLYAPISQEGKIRHLSAYSFSPLRILVDRPDELKPVSKVILRYDEAGKSVFLNGKYVGTINEWISTPYGKLKFVPTGKKYTGNEEKPLYFDLISPKDLTKNMLRSLTVISVNKLSSVIELSYRDEVPERAEDILNELVVMYDRASIDEKNSLARNTLQFVEERLSAVSQDLDSIERTVQNYKAGQGASDISVQGQLYLQNVSSNDQQLGRINMEMAVLDQVEKAVSSGNVSSGSVMPSTAGVSDQNLTKLISDLNAKELEYERLRKTVAENNPMLVSLRDQINKIKPSIVDNLSSQRKNLEASRGNLMATNSKYNSMLSTIPEKEKEILELSRDQSVKSGIYSFLLQKREESELSYASTLSDSRVINNAMAGKAPVSPNKMFVFLGAFAAAFVLGILFITAKEGFSSTILYRKDLEGMTQVPVIGEVAHNDNPEEIVITPGKRSVLAEEFRKIRVSLHFLGIDGTKKKILVTSSIPGEGKSVISANLAISSSLTGKKVALVDVDLHNPGLGKHFGKSTEDPGLSDYLTGQKKPEDIIKKAPGFESLFFISSGTLQESPSELLLNGKINEFVDYLEQRFDLVILDTAPSVLITDAYILTELCDATLFVVRHKHTPKMLLRRLDESLEVNPLKNLAIIFNGVKKRGFFKNNYGYGYDYVYGGQYGKTNEMKGKKKSKALKS